MDLSAVIFDLDGTLIDSEPVFRVVAKRAALEFDRDFTDELYLALIGLPGPEVETGIFDAFGPDFPMEPFKHRFEYHWHEHVNTDGIAIKPGVLELLQTLDDANVGYAIATSTPHDRARISLGLAGLNERFNHVIGGDQVTNGKPAPDIYLAAAGAIDAPPHRCIAIEDSKVGVRSAAAAKMHTIMIPDLKAPDSETRELATDIYPSLFEARAAIMALCGI